MAPNLILLSVHMTLMLLCFSANQSPVRWWRPLHRDIVLWCRRDWWRQVRTGRLFVLRVGACICLFRKSYRGCAKGTWSTHPWILRCDFGWHTGKLCVYYFCFRHLFMLCRKCHSNFVSLGTWRFLCLFCHLDGSCHLEDKGLRIARFSYIEVLSYRCFS